MNEEVVNVTEALAMLKRHALSIILLLATCLGLGTIALFFLPKTFRSQTSLNIQPGYFRNPLITDFVAQDSQQAEINAHRLSIFKYSLDDKFVDSIGERYAIYESRPDTPERIIERDLLLKQIELASDSATTVTLSVRAKAPDIAYLITKEILDRFMKTLVEERQGSLAKARDAIQGQATFISKVLQSSSIPAEVELLKTELAKLEASIDGLLLRYTPSHPEVVKLRQEAEGMRRRIARSDNNKELAIGPDNEALAESISAAMSEKTSRQSLENLYNDLVRKLSYLSITLNIDNADESKSYLTVIDPPILPVAPVSPRKEIVLGVSGVCGILLAAALILVKEIQRGSFLSPFRAAESLGVPLLGEMPTMPSAKDFLRAWRLESKALRGADPRLLSSGGERDKK